MLTFDDLTEKVQEDIKNGIIKTLGSAYDNELKRDY